MDESNHGGTKRRTALSSKGGDRERAVHGVDGMGPEPGSQEGKREGKVTEGRCILCGNAELTAVDSLIFCELRTIWGAMGIQFSAEAWADFPDERRAELSRCQACGFEFFGRSAAGNGNFYSELQAQSAKYYVEERPEFGWALDRSEVAAGAEVLDIGCGDGAFLDLARDRGLRTSGIELNAVAAEASRKKGHDIRSVDLAELARTKRGSFDLVTLFQVLEHVTDPVRFLRTSSELLRPGGWIAIGVPHAAGVLRICPLDPHQWPPHHLTRWRRRDLGHLAAASGLELVGAGTDQLGGWELWHFWTLENKLARACGRRVLPGGEWLPRVLSFVYRKAGCRYYMPRWGPNLFGLFRKTNRI